MKSSLMDDWCWVQGNLCFEPWISLTYTWHLTVTFTPTSFQVHPPKPPVWAPTHNTQMATPAAPWRRLSTLLQLYQASSAAVCSFTWMLVKAPLPASAWPRRFIQSCTSASPRTATVLCVSTWYLVLAFLVSFLGPAPSDSKRWCSHIADTNCFREFIHPLIFVARTYMDQTILPQTAKATTPRAQTWAHRKHQFSKCCSNQAVTNQWPGSNKSVTRQCW